MLRSAELRTPLARGLGQGEGYKVVSGHGQHVLLTIDGIGDGVRPKNVSTAAEVEFPQQLALLSIEGEEIAFVSSGKHEAASRYERTYPCRGEEAVLPYQLPGYGIESSKSPIGLVPAECILSTAAVARRTVWIQPWLA